MDELSSYPVADAANAKGSLIQSGERVLVEAHAIAVGVRLLVLMRGLLIMIRLVPAGLKLLLRDSRAGSEANRGVDERRR